MCGIFGSLSKNKKISAPIKNSLRFINQRGPDDNGKYEKAFKPWHLEICHTRLAILDLSKNGHQPMEKTGNPWVLAYNGEIYNFLEIKDELTQNGKKFITQSDTEVLLTAWQEWGVTGLSRLNGMFAIALFHKTTNELWLIRDRFGVKPLHWGFSPNKDTFVFSSSLAAVANHLNASVDTDTCALGIRYLLYESGSKNTCFQGVQSLPSAGWLRIRFKNESLSYDHGVWYKLQEKVEEKKHHINQITDGDLFDLCQEVFSDSVKIRLRSDVPVAVSLSGGLDSSSISFFASKNYHHLHAFTYGSPEAKMSEGSLAEQLAKKAGITPHFIWPKTDPGALDHLLENTLTAQEAPFSGFSVMAQNEIFRNVKQSGFKVLLGGQAGDEIFAGYQKFFLVAIRHAINARRLCDAFQFISSLSLMVLNNLYALSTNVQNLKRFRSSLNQPFQLLNWTVPSVNLLGHPKEDLSLRQIQDVKKWSLPSLLRYEDRNSMAYGVESRLPFMDFRLVELAIALPARLKIKHGFGKWTLREITKGLVPTPIRLSRKKRGFDVSQNWIESGLGKIIRDRINESLPILKPHLKKQISVARNLSNSSLANDQELLREAMMLCWMIKPIR